MIGLSGPDGPLRVGRTTGGVLEVRAATELGRAFGLGWGHARDRIVQLAVTRIAGRGRAAELLQGTDSLARQDAFLRHRGFARAAERQAGTLTPRARAIAESYAAGINRWLATHPRPAELAFLGVRPEPWTVQDSILVALLQSYLGLAQSQEVTERFIAHIGRSGHQDSIRVLKALFAPHLDAWDPALLDGVQLQELELPIDPVCASAFRAPLGSNAYVVPPGRSASGHAVVAGEPHLDTTWLPPSFVEAVLSGPHTLQAGVTVPGVPGVLAGRWTHVAAAITYGFLDQIDLFVEEVRAGQVRRGERWVPLEHTVDSVARRGSSATDEVDIWRSELGLVLGDPTGPEPVRTLALRWALDGQGMEDAFALPFALETATDVDAARTILARYPQSFQFTLADTAGRTGIQQCGLAPARAAGHSGLDPQAGWDRARWWSGTVPPEALFGETCAPDSSRILITANETTNPRGGPAVVNLGLSPDRRDRIGEVLGQGLVGPAELAAVLCDRRSLWSIRALQVVGPSLPPNRQGDLLRAWDGTWDPALEAPSLFARLEATWLVGVYGDLFARSRRVCPMPTEVAGEAEVPEDGPVLWSEANSVTTNVPAFRDALLDRQHPVFDGRDWQALLDEAIAAALSTPARQWSETNRIRGAWFLFAGNPLATAPFTSRPLVLPGAMDTPEQGRIHRIAGRIATVAPVWRMRADLGEAALHTALAGGPSDRLLSPRRHTDRGRFARYELTRLPLTPHA